MSAKILWVPQLSNYDASGRFILTADSNWNIAVCKLREMVKVDPNIRVDIVVPLPGDCLENAVTLLAENGLAKNVGLHHVPIIPSALVTRFDFPWRKVVDALGDHIKSYTHVYVNDPMLLRHYKALFHLNKAHPRFILQTHFLDSPIARIVDDEVSYWHGTVEACLKADDVLWHCRSMQAVFEEAVARDYQLHICEAIKVKSRAWKDGYSIAEVRKEVDHKNIRFDTRLLRDKTVVWVPNRVGGLGRSFDYTNNGRFLFDVVPEVWKRRQDFVVVAGNPNQKVTNDEIAARCPAYVKLLPGPVNRDEYRWLSERADIVAGLYTNDTNGGLASLEAIEFNAVPLFPDVFEYSVYMNEVEWPSKLRIKPDLSDAAEVMCNVLDVYAGSIIQDEYMRDMRRFIRHYASYEETTPAMMKRLGLADTYSDGREILT